MRSAGRMRDRYGPQVRFGLGAVRGVGEAALETMFDSRKASGGFRDLFDFATRVEAKRLNKGVLEALVQCGAFDAALEPMGITRARAYAAIDRALERSRSASRDRERGQATMFGIFEQSSARSNGNGHKTATPMDDYPPAAEWDKIELLKREREALGCYVSGHPLFRYQSKLGRLGVVFSSKVSSEEQWSAVSVAGIVENYEEKLFKSAAGAPRFSRLKTCMGASKPRCAAIGSTPIRTSSPVAIRCW